MPDIVMLTGHDLTPATLARIAEGAGVALADSGLAAMARTQALLITAIAQNRPMYGITTGLGPRVVERLSAAEQAEMSLNTIRGRAHSVGPLLPPATVRAALAVRANTLLVGASAADPALAHHIAACLDAGLTPQVRATGSIGAADLMWGANLGLGLIGEGTMDTPDGPRPAAEALATNGLAPYSPGPREGLALASHSSMTAAIAALNLVRAETSYETAQTAAALTLEGFRANLTPFDPRALTLRPQPGQMAAAEGIHARLAGSELLTPGNARRVQDPLSLRNIPQIHGAARAALDWLTEAITAEINGASDNPVALDTGEVLSAGGYLTPHLAIALSAASQSLVHLTAAQTARMARMNTPRFTDLAVGLAAQDTGSAGFAPMMKTAEALFSEIAQHAQPTPVYPGGGADGVEDVVTHAAVPAKALGEIIDRADRLSAMELLLATQAIEQRALPVPPALVHVMAGVRDISSHLTRDRPLGEEIESLAARVSAGAFTALAALAPPKGAGGVD